MFPLPEELRHLTIKKLESLSEEVRQYIITTLSSHPGHLASSLGTVELAIALHYVFNTPEDKVVWDVGHQAYAHKILTGRAEQFSSIRTYGGLSGFPKMDESPYDAFGTGHSSTSISAVLGMATASRLQGDDSRNHIAVIGDGSMTGGEAFEGLNNVGTSKANVLIVLNDNGISIDKAVGGLSRYLTRITASHRYNRLKENVWQHLDGGGKKRRHNRSISLLSRLTFFAKTALLGGSNLFESLGIRYFGPIDGHDMGELVKMLQRMKTIKGPKILHIVTTKGKGLAAAEQNPVVYHAPGKYDLATGERLSAAPQSTPLKYQEVFGRTLLQLAKDDPRIVAITPAMLSGSSLDIMKAELPERVFDVGIAEQHAVTFAAGMATQGLLPFCCIYSSFSQRAYDQIIHDVALQKLPVIICLDRAGLVGDDGATHHGVFDIAALRPIPNLTIFAPIDEHQLRNMMYTIKNHDFGTVVIRYPRGQGVHQQWENSFEDIALGKGRCLVEGSKIAIVSLGSIGQEGLKAAETLNNQGISTAVYDMQFLKPLDTDMLDTIANKGFDKIITIEDGVKNGGFGEAVMEYYAEKHFSICERIAILAIDDAFVPHGSVDILRHDCGIDAAAIIRQATN